MPTRSNLAYLAAGAAAGVFTAEAVENADPNADQVLLFWGLLAIAASLGWGSTTLALMLALALAVLVGWP